MLPRGASVSWRLAARRGFAAGTSDAREVAKFDNVQWQSTPLNVINPVRTAYIAGRVNLKGLRVVDVGCGGGLLSASLAALGAHVTAVDASAGALDAARRRADAAGVADRITFELGTPEDVAARGEAFDVVCAMEIVEHVTDPSLFVQKCAALAKPGASLFMSTLDRNTLSYLLGIVVAERVLNLLPRGTHDWKKFLTPGELSAEIGAAGLTVVDARSISYVAGPFGFERAWIADRRSNTVNYILHAKKPLAKPLEAADSPGDAPKATD
ncbi:S-adenosyl-L-methionine-dependent methyltransferase [Pelagophyceae sp. CCMP2097]|nr:S-adenosyl-L-methionine-dependent methyltransferase [Pelagophyceae sp. CCMP2097]